MEGYSYSLIWFCSITSGKFLGNMMDLDCRMHGSGREWTAVCTTDEECEEKGPISLPDPPDLSFYGLLEDLEGIAASVLCRIAEVILDPEQLVVLCKPVGAAHRACLDLTCLESDHEISDEAVLGLA